MNKCYVICLFLLGFVNSYKVKEGKVLVSNPKSADSVSRHSFTCCEPINGKLVVDDPLQTVDIQFKLETNSGTQIGANSAELPEQNVLYLESASGLQQSFIVTKYSSGKGKFEISIPVNKISPSLLNEQALEIGLVLSKGSDKSENKIFTIGEIEVSSSPESDIYKKVLKKYKAPVRYTTKPEIKHIFRAPAKQTKPVVALAFIALIVLDLLSFLAGIVMHKDQKTRKPLFNFARFYSSGDSVLDLVYKLGLIGSIVAYEVFFVQYYAYDSIFNLITKSFLMAGPTIWFGSRVFRYLLDKRTKGQN